MSGSVDEAVQLTPEQWWRVSELLACQPQRRPPEKNQRVLRAILHVRRHGLPWLDLPEEEYGVSWRTAWNQFKEWQRRGEWEEIEQCLTVRGQKAS